MKNRLFLVFEGFLLLGFHEIHAQSIFDEYGTKTTNLEAMPYASINLDAIDYNPAGTVFLRKGLELSASNLFPQFQIINNQNTNTFFVKNHEVTRTCHDNILWWVSNPSVRFSYRCGDYAISCSYAHGESLWKSDGNTCYDEMVQEVIPQNTDLLLRLISQKIYNSNNTANAIIKQYGVDAQTSYSDSTEFPMTLMSKSTQYGCQSERLSVGISHRVDFTDDGEWRLLSLYAGMKCQRLSLYQKTYIGPYFFDTKQNSVIYLRDICTEYSRLYDEFAKLIPDISAYCSNEARVLEAYGKSCDTMFVSLPLSSEQNIWGVNAVLGFNLVYPYWNVASTIEFGSLPFKYSVGYSQYIGRCQISLGGDFGYADANYGTYSGLFHKQLGFNLENYWYGDVGAEVACKLPKTCLTIKVGSVFGLNKDVLLSNGYEMLLKKHKVTCAPSCGFEWQASNMFALVGGLRIHGIPLSGKEFEVDGVINSSAKCVVEPEYQFSMGFVAHIE